MKRYLKMVLAGLLVLGFASPLYAQPDIKVNGQIRTRLRYWVNISLDSDVHPNASTFDRRYFDNRTRLGVDAKLADGVRAVIQLEKYFDFGNVQPNGTTSTGLATPSNSAADPYIRQAWMDFQIPGLPEGWRFQGGRSFFRVGNGFIWGNSLTGEDGFTIYGPLGPGTLKARMALPDNQSPSESGRTRLGDNEDWVFGLDYKAPVAERQNVEVYFVSQIDKGVDVYSDLVTNAQGTPVRHGEEYFIGVAYDGVVGPVALKAEAVGAFGKARRNVCFSGPNALTPDTNVDGNFFPATDPDGDDCDPTRTGNDIDRQAFMAYVNANYKITPAWSVGGAITYATGDDDPTDDTNDNFVAPLSEYTTSPSRVWTDSQFFFGNRTGRQVGNDADNDDLSNGGTAMFGTNRGYHFWGQGTEDVDSAASIADNLSPFSPGMWRLAFNTKYTFNKQVSGVLNVIPFWADKNPGGVSKYMGTEIDGKVAYKPYQNILINTYFGYFFAGGWFDQGGNLKAVTEAGGANPTVDDAWIFRWEAIVTF